MSGSAPDCQRHTAEFRKLAWSTLLVKTEFPYRRRLGCEIIRSCSSFPQNFKISVETKVSQSRALSRPHCKNAYCNTCCKLQRIINICVFVWLVRAFLFLCYIDMHALLAFISSIAFVQNMRENDEVYKSGCICRFWEMLAYLANTLIFAIVGILIVRNIDQVTADDVGYLFMIYVSINVIR